jgi:hypothetical protein
LTRQIHSCSLDLPIVASATSAAVALPYEDVAHRTHPARLPLADVLPGAHEDARGRVGLDLRRSSSQLRFLPPPQSNIGRKQTPRSSIQAGLSTAARPVGDDAVLAGEVLYRSPLQHLDPLTSVYLTWVTRFSPTSCLPWGLTDPKVMHLDISTVSFIFNVHRNIILKFQ